MEDIWSSIKEVNDWDCDVAGTRKDLVFGV